MLFPFYFFVKNLQFYFLFLSFVIDKMHDMRIYFHILFVSTSLLYFLFHPLVKLMVIYYRLQHYYYFNSKNFEEYMSISICETIFFQNYKIEPYLELLEI
jgi:hypothetical protein